MHFLPRQHEVGQQHTQTLTEVGFCLAPCAGTIAIGVGETSFVWVAVTQCLVPYTCFYMHGARAMFLSRCCTSSALAVFGSYRVWPHIAHSLLHDGWQPFLPLSLPWPNLSHSHKLYIPLKCSLEGMSGKCADATTESGKVCVPFQRGKVIFWPDIALPSCFLDLCLLLSWEANLCYWLIYEGDVHMDLYIQ